MNMLARSLQRWFVDHGGTFVPRSAVTAVRSDPVHTVITEDGREQLRALGFTV